MQRFKKSYLSGSSSQPLIGQTIGDIFDQACAEHAYKEALVSSHQNVRLSYHELKEKVEALACQLLEIGFKKGDRLGIWSPNCWEWTVTQFAAAKAGLILVNLNPSYKSTDLIEYVLNKVAVKGLVMAEPLKSTDYEALLGEIAPEIYQQTNKSLECARLPHLKTVIKLSENALPSCYSFYDLLTTPTHEQVQELHALSDSLQFDDVINIQFTSGTTGSPKGTMLTHHNILNNGYFVGEGIKLTESDKICIAVPLFHCFGMVMGNLAAVSHGATMVYPSAVFNPQDTLKAIANEGCTAAYGVPTIFINMLEQENFDDFDLSSLRTGIMAGSPCPKEIMTRVMERMHMSEITICYGMTETSPVSVQSYVDDPIDKRVSTVGRIHPHVELKIVDENNHIVPVGALGEICVRGYSVMAGYWDDEQKTREVIDEHGWMHTGDIGKMDDEGYVQIKGRIKDIVIRGGENLFPKEIEDFLYKHPAVGEVQVVGVPDPKYGEELCACIIVHDQHECDSESIREFCKNKISHNKIPRYVRFVTEFPMTASGKIQKFKLREQMCEVLGISLDDD
ncbi:fatty acid--CoA ligase [Moraxella caviae]|uniref:Fatty acid--CoA ligase n=1 Tax=Moraxella caviae TaxID=34060 RepID=A0A1T0A8G4_9GAMM|nr:AMP-binding protein [Moraxella caviae]OOR91898.1 fatty acid--CoA ligase [Moraxella caviae]STZ09752.1 Long-chain-fatty-acid--CoA ligase [Moraxella caviae]